MGPVRGGKTVSPAVKGTGGCCLLCGFGGQCFGLEKSHGGLSVVKCVLMNELDESCGEWSSVQ